MSQEKKRIKITLDETSLEILNSLSTRYNLTKTQIICQAIRYLAANKKTYIKIGLFPVIDKEEQEKQQKQLEENIRIAKVKWIKE